jgi:hypothetical protein
MGGCEWPRISDRFQNTSLKCGMQRLDLGVLGLGR